MDKLKRDDAPIKVYKPTWPILFANGLILLPTFSIIAFLIWEFLKMAILYRSRLDGFSVVMLLVLFSLQGYVLWIIYIVSFGTRLAIYKDGLDLQQGRSHFFVSWENMSHFGGKSNGKGLMLGIYLHEIVPPEVTGIVEGLHFGWVNNFLPITAVRQLPRRWIGSFGGVTVDAEALAQKEFGRELLHYAPQLFEKSKEKAKNS